MTKQVLQVGSENRIYDDLEFPNGISSPTAIYSGAAPSNANEVLRLDDLGTIIAPFDAQYVVLATDTNLTAERVLTAGNSITLSDGGAGGLVTLDTIQDIRISASPTFGGLTVSFAGGIGEIIQATASGSTNSILQLLSTTSTTPFDWRLSGLGSDGSFRVGEGSTTRFTLDPGGDISTTGHINISNSKSIGIGAALERIEFYTAGYVSVMGANLGIGTVTPASLLDVNGDIRISNGTQDYVFGKMLNTALTISSKTAATSADLWFFCNDGDGTDNVSISIFGVGTTASVTNRERLSLGYFAANTQFEIFSEINGTGTLRPVVLYTEGNANQLFLGTNGNVAIAHTTPLATLDVVGTVRLGDSTTNYTGFSTTGVLNMYGSAIVLDDLQISLGSVKPGSSAPTETVYKGCKVLSFSQSQDNKITFTAQLPHGYQEGSDIQFHIHTVHPVASAGDSSWTMTYSWANRNSDFPAETTVADVIIASPVDADKHEIHPIIETISGTGKLISSVLLCSLEREGTSVDDDYASSIYLVSLDFHYSKDTLGSRSLYIK